MFSGSIPALVTTFRDEALDERAYRDFCAWQVSEGCTGAGAVRHDRRIGDADQRDEHRRCIELAVERRRAGLT